jgi:putative transposase
VSAVSELQSRLIGQLLEGAEGVPLQQGCEALGINRAKVYRHKARRSNTQTLLSSGSFSLEKERAESNRDSGEKSRDSARRMCRVTGRTLDSQEEDRLLELLHSARFIDQAPAQIYAALLDEGRYVCSIRTMYRLLSRHKEVKERRRQRRHVKYEPPQLLATQVNQVWSWDITRLLGPEKWTYYSLYVVMDIYSRYVVGWMVAPKESAALAEHLIQEACLRQGIGRGQLTIHADRGASMTSRTVAQLLMELGVVKTHSRPYCSNDNPFSESQFKTMKYRPEFPERFGSLKDAEVHCQAFFPWYNQEHYHSGIAYLTPETVHYGRAEQVLAARSEVLRAAHKEHPRRFINRPPEPAALPQAVWINAPQPKESSAAAPSAGAENGAD